MLSYLISTRIVYLIYSLQNIVLFIHNIDLYVMHTIFSLQNIVYFCITQSYTVMHYAYYALLEQFLFCASYTLIHHAHHCFYRTLFYFCITLSPVYQKLYFTKLILKMETSQLQSKEDIHTHL